LNHNVAELEKKMVVL